uniref:Transposase n=1 Tax=Macrostomum lignano TaxID=282301 RepID=A0A1I8FRY6_9PLAT
LCNDTLESPDSGYFDRKLSDIENEWPSQGPVGAVMFQYIKKKAADTLKQKATRFRLSEAGLNSAWQQRQERLNRDLKAFRVRTATHIDLRPGAGDTRGNKNPSRLRRPPRKAPMETPFPSEMANSEECRPWENDHPLFVAFTSG